MTDDKKQCSKCKVFQPLDFYRDECKQCHLCLEAKRRYRQKYRERENEKSKQYYQQHKEELSERKKEMIECKLCKCFVRKYTMDRHQQSIKHQRKIKYDDRNHQETIQYLNDTFPPYTDG